LQNYEKNIANSKELVNKLQKENAGLIKKLDLEIMVNVM